MNPCEQYLVSLGNFRRGTLDEAEHGPLQAHLDGCADCTAFNAILDQMESGEPRSDADWDRAKSAIEKRIQRDRRLFVANVVGLVVMLPVLALWMLNMPGVPMWTVALSLMASLLLGGAVLLALHKQLGPRPVDAVERAEDLMERCRRDLRRDIGQLERGRWFVAFAMIPGVSAAASFSSGNSVVGVGLVVAATFIVAVFAHAHFARLPKLRLELGELEQ